MDLSIGHETFNVLDRKPGDRSILPNLSRSRRSSQLKSPRSNRRFNDGGKRALNLSPAIATILPQNSKSEKQKNDYQGDHLLMLTHGLLASGRKGSKGSPTSRTASPVLHMAMSVNKFSGFLHEGS